MYDFSIILVPFVLVIECVPGKNRNKPGYSSQLPQRKSIVGVFSRKFLKVTEPL